MFKRMIAGLSAVLSLSVFGLTAYAEPAKGNEDSVSAAESAEITESAAETDSSSSSNNMGTASDTGYVHEPPAGFGTGTSDTSSEDDTEGSDSTAEASSEQDSEPVLTDKEYQLIKELADGLAKEDEKTDYYGDPYYDTSGNASLITSENIVLSSDKMQFISITTKDGHVFYVLINYAAKDGENAVYFLNKVDDFDLYALLYADDSENDMTPEEAAEQATEGRVKPSHKTSSSAADKGDDEGEEDTSSADSSSKAQENGKQPLIPKKNLIITGALLAAMAIVAILFFKMNGKGGSKKKKLDDDLDDIDEMEINEDEE